MSHSSSISQSAKIAGKKQSNVVLHNAETISSPLTSIKWLDSLLENYEFNRYGISAIVLLIMGTLAAVAVGVGAMSNPIEIAILVVPTMATLVMVLAVQPMRPLLYIFFITCLIDLGVIGYHLITWSEPLSTIF